MLACLAMMSTSAWSLGVGRPQTASSLGQPLNLFFPVQIAPGEVVTADCIRADVTAGESQLPSSSLRWQLETDGQQTLRGVRLRSSQSINEPLVVVNLTLGCSSSFTRQYTAFIDPPGHSAEPLADAGSQSETALAPAFQVATDGETRINARDASPSRTRSGPIPDISGASAPASAASAPPRKRRQTAARNAGNVAAAAAAAAPQKSGGARLSMEPAEILAPAPNAPLIAEAASAASAAAEARAQLAVMEKRVADLQAEQRRTNEVLQALREELKATREQRDSAGTPVWMLALTLLSLALAASSLLLWRNRGRDRKDAPQTWWGEAQGEGAQAGAAVPSGPSGPGSGAGAPGVAGADLDSGTGALHSAPGAAAAALVALDRKELSAATHAPTTMPMPLSITDPERTMQLPPRAAPAPSPEVSAAASGLQASRPGRSAATAAADDALDALASLDAMQPLSFEMREPPGDTRPAPLLRDLNGLGAVTVEELIDLEQQVDFFLVLGQDDAAIELLSSRLGERDAASGLPYLKLMELYQRRADRASFDRVATRFSQQFRARPPAWSDDLNEGAGLEAHPELVDRLQSAWVDAAGSMSLLQDLFSHHQEYSGELGLPAYRDLLLLYAVARDRAEHESRTQDIDVFLPLDATAPPDMMATMTWQAPASAPAAGSSGRSLRPGVGQSLDVDLDLTLANDDDDQPKKPKAY